MSSASTMKGLHARLVQSTRVAAVSRPVTGLRSWLDYRLLYETCLCMSCQERTLGTALPEAVRSP